jgi:hypothetical protein
MYEAQQLTSKKLYSFSALRQHFYQPGKILAKIRNKPDYQLFEKTLYLRRYVLCPYNYMK